MKLFLLVSTLWALCLAQVAFGQQHTPDLAAGNSSGGGGGTPQQLICKVAGSAPTQVNVCIVGDSVVMTWHARNPLETGISYDIFVCDNVPSENQRNMGNATDKANPLAVRIGTSTTTSFEFKGAPAAVNHHFCVAAVTYRCQQNSMSWPVTPTLCK